MSGRGKDIVQAGNTVLVSVPAQIVGNAYFRERGRLHWGALQRGFDALAAAGYAVVPVEPSIEQLDRALHDIGCPNPKMSRQQLRDFYRAMIVAAKEPMQ
jgi:hypothetical protein